MVTTHYGILNQEEEEHLFGESAIRHLMLY